MFIKKEIEEFLENQEMGEMRSSNTIRLGNLCGLFVTGTAFSLLRDSFLYFVWNLELSTLSFSSCAFINFLLKRSENRGLYQKIFLEGLMVLHLFPIAWNAFYFGECALPRIYLESQSIARLEEIDSSADGLLFLQDALDRNSFIDSNQKEIIQGLFPYFQENPYLDYEQVYLNLATLKISFEDSSEKLEQGTVAEYFSGFNIVRFYGQEEDVERYLPHEVLHATGSFETRFLREGFDSLLVSEYLYDGKIVDGYVPEIYLTSIIIELAGKDAVLEAFSRKDEGILMNRLEEMLSSSDVQTLLESFEVYAQVKQQYRKNQITVQESVDAFLEMGKILMDCLQKTDLTEEQEAYIYRCFLNAGKGTHLLKFCYNSQKDWGYPNDGISSEGVIKSMQEMLYQSGFSSEKVFSKKNTFYRNF